MQATKAAFRLRIKREERLQEDLFEQATGPYAYHVVASNWPHKEKSAHEMLVWHSQHGQAESLTRN